MAFVIPAPPAPVLPVADSGALFPVRRIYCVGRNYADHAREMGGNPDREPPFFFGKPSDAVVPGGGDIAYPPLTSNLHHEVELVVALGSGGRDIPVEKALACVYGYAVGIDLTRRDLQAALKEKGQPWEMAKGFDHAAVCGPLRPVAAPPQRGAVQLWVNDAPRQHGDLAEMIWSIPEIIADLSRWVELRPGDLIFSGTPEGVGPVVPGDLLRASVAGVGELVVRIAAPADAG